MRKLGFILLTLFASLALLAAILQSSWGKGKVYSALAKALQQSGIRLEIGKIRDILPNTIDLEQIEIETEEFFLSIEKLRLRFSWLRLLKRELNLSEVRGSGVIWKIKNGKSGDFSLPFLLNVQRFQLAHISVPDWGWIDLGGYLRMGRKGRHAFFDVIATSPNLPKNSARLLFALKRDRTAQMRLDVMMPTFSSEPSLFLRATARGPWSAWRGEKGDILGRLKANLHAVSPLEGELTALFQLRSEKDGRSARVSWRVPALTFQTHSAEKISGKLEGRWKEHFLEGAGAFRGELFSKPWQGKGEFSWEPGAPLQISSYHLSGPSLELKGELAVHPDGTPTGSSELEIGQLQELFPSVLFGHISARATLSASPISTLRLEGTASHLYWKELFAERITCDLYGPIEALEGTLFLEKGKWNTLFLESARFETSHEGPFRLIAEGRWKHPLSLECEGAWHWEKPLFSLSLERAAGSFFNHPIALIAPSHFTCSPTIFQMDAFDWRVGRGSLFASFKRAEEEVDASLRADTLPLDFLSLNPLDVPISGLFSCNAELKERRSQLQGVFTTSVEQLEIAPIGTALPLHASGTFSGTFDQEQLHLKGNLATRDAPLFALDLSLPLSLEISPPRAHLFLDRAASGHLAFNGRLEEILDFFNLGGHRIEGECTSEIALSNTLAHPYLEGYCDIENGFYQNYYTGTELQDIHAQFIAEKETLRLRSLKGKDVQKKGAFSAVGEIALIPSQRFPFHFSADFSRLNCVQLNLVTAEASGKIALRGNFDKATATGSVEILESDLAIPNRIPRSLPDLEVVYRNASQPLPPPEPAQREVYPLFLDLSIRAPDGIFISGRGLESEWKGDFHLEGTYTEPAAKGKIELIKGTFLFSNRTFKLTEGALTLSGEAREMPHLNLSGTMQTSGITLIARLRGPLNNPQLTLQSVPPLPLSSILSYLLFGHDLSEINSFQALQLVNSLANLAGEGPDVLEKSRRALGVDRLQIISVPTGDEEETIAVQVGKYVAEGIIVTVSQGAEDAGTNLAVEVELKHGFSFQVETQQRQEQEQGKFSLKWGVNY